MAWFGDILPNRWIFGRSIFTGQPTILYMLVWIRSIIGIIPKMGLVSRGTLPSLVASPQWQDMNGKPCIPSSGDHFPSWNGHTVGPPHFHRIPYPLVIKYWSLPQNPRISSMIFPRYHFVRGLPQLASLRTLKAFVIPIVKIVTIDIPYSVSLFMIINYHIVLLLSY